MGRKRGQHTCIAGSRRHKHGVHHAADGLAAETEQVRVVKDFLLPLDAAVVNLALQAVV